MSDKPTTDEMLTALGWHTETLPMIGDCVFDANMQCRLREENGRWYATNDEGVTSGDGYGYESLDAAVDAAHAAKFPARQPLDEATFKRLIDEGQQNMKAFEAERRAGFPRKSDGRAAELNEPVTMPDEDCCETSQTDLQTAEIERNWNDVAWLQAELIKARDRIAKQATEAAEKRTAYNAEIDGLRAALAEAGALANKRGEEIVKLNAAANRQHAADKWESQAVRLEWSPWDADKETDLRATFGGFSAYIARITIDSQVTAKLYYTDTTNGETVTITGLDLAKIEPILSTLVEAAGFTMPPIPALPVQE